MKSIELSISEAKKIIKLPNWHNIGIDYVTNGSPTNSSLTYWNISSGELIELQIDKHRLKNSEKALYSIPV